MYSLFAFYKFAVNVVSLLLSAIVTKPNIRKQFWSHSCRNAGDFIEFINFFFIFLQLYPFTVPVCDVAVLKS